ncbi:MAG: hypothetical protein AB7V77_02175 [Candidatus Woesearchaeota archaeon]
MKIKHLTICYVLTFLTLLSLFFESNNVLKIIKLILVIAFSYCIYYITSEKYSRTGIKEFNYLFVAVMFIFTLYSSGYKGIFYYDILVNITALSLFGLLISSIYKENNKRVLIVPRKPAPEIKSTITTVKKPEEELYKIIQEAKALVKAEKEIKKATKKKTAKKVTKKPVVKKKVVKKTSAKKKTTTKRKVVKKK